MVTMKIKKFLRRTSLILICVISTTAVAAFCWQIWQTKSVEASLPMPGQLVDASGYKVHVRIAGESTGPAVVLVGGLFSNSYDWLDWQDMAAEHFKVVLYDRAGQGWSESAPHERTTENMVEELRATLAGAGVEPPYVLLGWSLGGWISRVYASTYPDEVVGMVLAEAANLEVPMPNAETFLKRAKVFKYGAPFGVPRMLMLRRFSDGNSNVKKGIRFRTRPSEVNAWYQEIQGLLPEKVSHTLKEFDPSPSIPIAVVTASSGSSGVPFPEWWEDVQEANQAMSGDIEQVNIDSGHQLFAADPAILINAVHSVLGKAVNNEP